MLPTGVMKISKTTLIIRFLFFFSSMKERVDLAETQVATIKELTELHRLKTVNELEELFEKYGKK